MLKAKIRETGQTVEVSGIRKNNPGSWPYWIREIDKTRKPIFNEDFDTWTESQLIFN